MDELTRPDDPAEHLDRAVPAHRMHVGMADAEPAGQGLEAGVGHLVNVADRPVRDRADTAQCTVGVAVDLAPERADDPRLVEILDNHDLRPGHAGNVAPVFQPGVRAGLAMPPLRRLDHHRHRVADHRPHRRHEVAHLLQIEGVGGGIGPGDLLPAVVHGGGVPALKLQEVGVGKRHGGPPSWRDRRGGSPEKCRRPSGLKKNRPRPPGNAAGRKNTSPDHLTPGFLCVHSRPFPWED